MATPGNQLFGAQNQFSEEQKLVAWQKATVVPGYNSANYRKDRYGAWIKWGDYGNTSSKWGWEVDHIYPVSRGGTDNPDNLQALHWKNNRAKGDSIGHIVPAVTATS